MRDTGEARDFERALRVTRDKRDLVNSIVAKARGYEERSQFSEAQGQWEILQTIHKQYPGLEFEIQRVMKRREQQARNEAKARWVEQIDRQLEAGDYEKAIELVRKAVEEFPGDQEMAALDALAKLKQAYALETSAKDENSRPKRDDMIAQIVQLKADAQAAMIVTP